MEPEEGLTYEQGVDLQDWVQTLPRGRQGCWDLLKMLERIHLLFLADFQEVETVPLRVVGGRIHYGVPIPICSLKLEGMEIRMAGESFDGWQVSIRSKLRIPDCFYRLFDRNAKLASEDCPGFSHDWIFGSYANDQCRFTVKLDSDYELYTFLYIMSEVMQLRPANAGTRRYKRPAI